ncbi:hypothetical protein LP097_13010 [Moraxella bovis]|uniref:XRE family transcriptional regulator n=1 Tax=Moraxella bovis TaxID=476 RepID=UPI002227A823|nr:S24 family peptidase [Moraxella bovis]UZA29802.1 hypothetical protein LP097_13010 [Moraxella bovis]
MYDKNFAERLDFVVDKLGGAVKACQLAEITHPTLMRWKDGTSDPKISNLLAFTKAGNVSLDWLMTGNGSPDGMNVHTNQPAANDSDYKDIPVYDLAASAGTGRLVVDEHITNYLKFPNWWFDERGLQHNSIAGLYTKGDSMEPTIPDNSLLLIDQSKTYLSDGKVYVIRADDELYVKRVKRIFGGG